MTVVPAGMPYDDSFPEALLRFSLTGCVGLACWTGLGQFGLRLSLIGLMALVGKSNAGLGLFAIGFCVGV